MFQDFDRRSGLHSQRITPIATIADLDDVVGGDTQEVAVEGGVVEFAEGQTIGDPRFAPGMLIGQNVRGIEQFLMLQSAYRAALAVGFDHPDSETLLVQASLR